MVAMDIHAEAEAHLAAADPVIARLIAAPWHPYASIATWYLWRSLNNAPQNPQ